MEGNLAAGVGRIICSVGAVAGDAQRLGIVAAEIGLLRRVAQMGHAKTRFSEQGGREDVIVVRACAICRCGSGRFKATVCGASEERTEQRRLVSVDVLMAETAAQVILLSDRVIRLDVVAGGVFVERKVLRKIIAECAGDVCCRRKILCGISRQGIQVLQNG